MRKKVVNKRIIKKHRDKVAVGLLGDEEITRKSFIKLGDLDHSVLDKEIEEIDNERIKSHNLQFSRISNAKELVRMKLINDKDLEEIAMINMMLIDEGKELNAEDFTSAHTLSIANVFNIEADVLDSRTKSLTYNYNKKGIFRINAMAVMCHKGFLYSVIVNRKGYKVDGRFFTEDKLKKAIKPVVLKSEKLNKSQKIELLNMIVRNYIEDVRKTLIEISFSETVYLYSNSKEPLVKEDKLILKEFGNIDDNNIEDTIIKSILEIMDDSKDNKINRIISLFHLGENTIGYLSKALIREGTNLLVIGNRTSLNTMNSITNKKLPNDLLSGSGYYKDIDIPTNIKIPEIENGGKLPRHINLLRNIILEETITLPDKVKVGRKAHNRAYSVAIRLISSRHNLQREVINMMESRLDSKDKIPYIAINMLVSRYIGYLVNFKSFQGSIHDLVNKLIYLIVNKILESLEMKDYLDSFSTTTDKNIKDFQYKGKKLQNVVGYILSSVRDYFMDTMHSPNIIDSYRLTLKEKMASEHNSRLSAGEERVYASSNLTEEELEERPFAIMEFRSAANNFDMKWFIEWLKNKRIKHG